MKPSKKIAYRSPDQVVDQRVAEACAVIAQNPAIHRCELHKLFRPMWKNKAGEECHWRTVDRLCDRARKMLIQRSRRPKDAWIDDLLAGYDVDMAHADPTVRMAARLGIRKMLGLDAPARTELTGADGQPLKGDVTVILWPHQANNDEHSKLTIEAETVRELPEKTGAET